MVEGRLTYSSSSCGGIELGRNDYDADEGRLTATIRWYYERPSDADCTADEVTRAYRATFPFDDGTPEAVAVTEDGNTGTFEETAS
ncbi:hypothetical protein [Halovivax sp.]|uniref:hypothetical protein n=1 Tax=Halovivax sp. TaxID=1935978 RepID=UPI0025C1079A|nr:hypothetical protein [Halovivax sp.]